MIDRKLRILASTVFCLLAAAGPAAAECAWVLWSQVHDPNPGGWMLQTAYPGVSDCTKALDQREKDGRKAIYKSESGAQVKGVSERRAPTDLFVLFGRDASKGGVAWQCFPETIDPRGAKGK